MVKAVPIGNVVEEYKIGNTTIKICDDAYRDKTPDELEQTRERIMSAAWNCILTARANGKDV